MAHHGQVVIRRILESEGEVLRDLRLRSLADAPDAFGQRLDEAQAVPDAEWRRVARASARGDGRAWFLAFRDGQAVGLVQGRRRPPATLLLFSLWVDPTERRNRVGWSVIDALEAWAALWHADETVLWVHAGNAVALAFYRSLGFDVMTDGRDAESGARFGALALRRRRHPSSD
jgi:GNAT superfamily N-acetyltransferase